jgi:outer membrane lipoprotein SlyB
MRASAKPVLALFLLGLALVACAPANTGSTYSRQQVNRAANVSTGTIVSMRDVAVQGQGNTGAFVGAAAGGVGGSFIGGDWRSNLLAGLGGAVIGGIAGNAAERAATGGTATEFIIEVAGGGTIAVVQTNEEGFRVGDRVTILQGDRTRLTPIRS